MKGMLDFLERAGLVRQDAPQEQRAPAPESAPRATAPDNAASTVPMSAPFTAAPSTLASDSGGTIAPMAGAGVALNLDAIYAHGGVAPALYPAERLLRLLDGLGAMDEATRLMAVRAMDAADESWSIEDPLADASAKIQALATYAQQVQANLQDLQIQAQSRLEAIAARQEQVVGDIRKQITELEALVSRELSRAANDTATQQAELKAAQEQAARELAEIARISQRLQSLSRQFGATPTAKE